jgi:oxygen-independent coproporphyrinogen-3 oxidase
MTPTTMRTLLPSAEKILAAIDTHTRPVPRYTSYPTVPYWDREFGEVDYLDAIAESGGSAAGPISVYVHLPFCAKRCYYCGCNAVAARRPEVVDRYLDHLEWEIRVVADCLGTRRMVSHIHWGGGTPNFLSDEQTARLVGVLNDVFILEDGAEVSIEMDPRVATRQQPAMLEKLGFNRLSMGVQDFDEKVQRAIGRIQPEEETVRLLEGAREAGFDSVNFDLVYGLPYQTPKSFRRTLDRVVELGPDRIATFSYAHLPEQRPIQRAVDASGMPDAPTKLGLFLDTVNVLEEAGYQWIGFDHFARPDDELAVAARERRLMRNFMGYTTEIAPDMVAFGMSGIGFVGGRFVQNDADLARWESTVREGRLPVVRGYRLTRDDEIRGMIIQHLMCNLEVPENLTVERFGGSVSSLLGEDAHGFESMRVEGFLAPNDAGWEVTPLGRFFLRNIAASIDPWLTRSNRLPVFSSSV